MKSLALVLHIAGYAIPAILHSIGIILLYKSKGELPNQRLVTLNLAVSEMLYCWLSVIHYAIVLQSSLTTSKYYQAIYVFFHTTLFATIRFTMFHIIIDRYFDIRLNLKYLVYLNKKILIRIIIFQWVLAIFITLLSIALLYYKVVSPYTFRYATIIVTLCIDIIIIITAFSTFTYLFIKVKSALYGTTQQGGRTKSPMVWIKLRIPISMALTYVHKK